MRGIDRAVPSVLIENAPGSGDAPADGPGVAIRAALGLNAQTPVILYTGTFEAYQGLDLLFSSMRQVLIERPAARLVLAGGRPDQIARGTAAGGTRSHRDGHDLCGSAACRRDPGVSGRG